MRGKCRIEMRAWARDVNQEGGERDIDISKIITHTCEGQRSQVYELRQPTDTDTDTQTQTQTYRNTRVAEYRLTGRQAQTGTNRLTDRHQKGHTDTPLHPHLH